MKIHDLERLETPHATISRRTLRWRLGLRDGGFLDREPSPRRLPAQLVSYVLDQVDLLRAEWDRRFPDNPVGLGDG